MNDDHRGKVRACAGDLIEILDEVGDEILRQEKAIRAVLQDLLGVPGLDTVNANPTGSDLGSAMGTGWLYYDCDLRIVRGRMQAGFAQSPHDHGGWNIFAVYRGAAHYRSYRRTDDGSQPFRADLEVIEDRIMSDGDVTLLPAPPGDIHAVAGLAPETVTLLVARGPFSAVRRQFMPERHAYYEVPAEQAAG